MQAITVKAFKMSTIGSLLRRGRTADYAAAEMGCEMGVGRRQMKYGMTQVCSNVGSTRVVLVNKASCMALYRSTAESS